MLNEKPWRVEAVIQFCGSLLACLCLGSLIIGLLEKSGLAAFQPPDGMGAILIGTLSFQGAAWGLIAIFLWQHEIRWLEFFGLRDPQLLRTLKLALITVIILLPVLWCLEVTFTELLTWLRHKPPENELAVELILKSKSVWGLVYLGVFAVVLAPVAEEFIFRGMLFPFVKQLGLPRVAWLGVSGLFALIHANAAALVPLFVMALVLTWLYEKTNSLLAPIAVHALFNAANLAVLLAGKESLAT